MSRPGTLFVANTRNSAVARLAEIVFDTTSAFVVEFGVQYIRFFKNGAVVSIASSGSWTTGTVYGYGAVVTSTNGTTGSAYLCIEGHTAGSTTEPEIGANWQTKWYELAYQVPGSTGSGPWIYELPTPYSATEVFELQVRGYSLNSVPIVHRNHAPRVLTRYADNNWEIDVIDFTTSAVPTPQNLTVTPSGGGITAGPSETNWGYIVTAIVNGVESVATTASRTSLVAGFDLAASVWSALHSHPITVEWDAVAGATAYKLYANGGDSWWGWFVTEVPDLGATPVQFVDDGVVFAAAANSGQLLQNIRPPTPTTSFQAAGEYPGVVGAYQQRLLLAGSTNKPDVVEASKSGDPYNFTVSNPIVDSDAIQWRQVGAQMNRVLHFAEAAQRLIQFSTIGESVIQGDGDGVLVPGGVNPRQFSQNGAAPYPSPLVINDSMVYVQARGGIVRDLYPSETNLLGGTDISIASAHLVDGYRITSWCFQQTPDPIIWAVRDDGVLLSLTYSREAGVLGWARHDSRTSGGQSKFLSVACVPENNRDVVYAVVERVIYVGPGPGTVGFIERFADRYAPNPVTVDCATVYSGAATTTITGLNRFEFQEVAVVTGGNTVVSSPFNTAQYPNPLTVSFGTLTLPTAATNVVVGLPMVVDVQTLDLDAVDVTVKQRGMHVGGVVAWVEKSGAFYASPKAPSSATSVTNMERVVPKDDEGYPVTTLTGVMQSPVLATYNNTGRIFLRQVDPLPLTLLGIAPAGYLQGGR